MDAAKFNRLLKNVRADKKSLRQLYDYYYPKIVLHVGRIYEKEIAEDVAQEFFLGLYSAAQGGYIKSPTAWVYACCDNVAKKYVKANMQTVSLTDDVVFDRCGAELIFGDLYKAIESLDGFSKNLIYLHYWEGYNLSELAEAYDLSYEAVKKRHQRALKKIKRNLIEGDKTGV